MAEGEKSEQKGDKPGEKPKPTDSLRQNVDANIRAEAEKLLSGPDFKDKLKPETIQKFVESHSRENYKGYREWNEDFCKTVLGIEKSEAVEQRTRVIALQLFLNEKVKGFTEKKNRSESLDGKLGPFTLSKLNEYYETLKQPEPKTPRARIDTPAPEKKPDAPSPKPEQTLSQGKETVPGVISRLPEGAKFGNDETFYVGDSIMVGISGGRRVDDAQKIARVSSHLVKTPQFDNEKYRKNKIFVEEEAMKFLEDRKCKMLVINGGGNDLGARGRTDKVRQEIIDAYKRIIDAAHKKGVKITIYAKNDEAEAKAEPHISIYKWLREKSGADVLIDSTTIVAGRFGGKMPHPTAPAYRDLYKSLDFLRA